MTPVFLGMICIARESSMQRKLRIRTAHHLTICQCICQQGMRYIHRSSLKCHGNLKSSACLVDSRWTVKLSGFGLQSLTRNKTAVKVEDESKYAELIWTAPEILMLGVKASPEGTDKGDVYSFGILLQEILYRNSFFFGSDVSAEGRPMCRQSRFFFFFIRLLLPVVATSDCPSPYVPAFCIRLRHFN